MRRIMMKHSLAFTAAAAVIMAGATTAPGEISLTNIPTLTISGVADTSNEGRAITCDGKYVGGISGAGNGFFYDVANNLATNPVAGSAAKNITGIAYRYDTNQSPAVIQVVLDGNNSGYHGQYATSDGGYTWAFKRRDNGTPQYSFTDYPSPLANSLAGTTAGDVYYNIFRNSAASSVYTCKGSNLWNSSVAALVSITGKGLSSDTGDVKGVAALSGRIVGYRKASGATLANNTLWEYPPTGGNQLQWPGLAGNNQGEAWCVSQDGTCIFGRSPIVPDEVVYYGYKAIVTAATDVPARTWQGTTRLPNFSDTAGSVSLAVPYGCTADGKYAVGMNYRGREAAVLWDTSNANPNAWTITDLYALAAANGAPDIFDRLNRAYSVGTNAAGDPVITGIGWDPTVPATRAFLMTVPRWIAAIGFPGHQTVSYGANVTFALTTNGTDALTYQWYKNGTEMPGATTTSLAFNNVSCAGGQAGNYQVVVSNTAISAVVTGYVATLTVLDPYLSSQPSPSSRTNLTGTTVTYSVSADSSGGPSSLSYQWQRNGVDLTDGDPGWGSGISGATTATLTITNLQVSDSGSYKVLVTTSAGGCATASSSVKLAVKDPPVISSFGPVAPGYYVLNLSGPYQEEYRVLYTTNLALPLSSWTPLVTNTFTGAGDACMDVAPPDPQRFYILYCPKFFLTPP